MALNPVKFYRWVRRMFVQYPADGSEAIRAALTEGASGSRRSVGRPVVAIQCVPDRFYFGLFGAIARRMREHGNVAIELVVVQSISAAMGAGWRARIERSAPLAFLRMAPWVRLFEGLVDGIGYRSSSYAHPVGDLVDYFRSWFIWLRRMEAKELAGLKVDGVPVGDLIIDSYLRFRPAPRLDCHDPFLISLIWQAHRDVRRARLYFGSSKVKLYLTSYSTYIEHGVAARVALREGVSVRSYGSLSQIGKLLSTRDWFHTPDASGYRLTFGRLERQPDRLREAEAQLGGRMSGGIDLGTSYMRVSAYAAGSEPTPDVSGATIVFLHDFFDSVHVYADLIFHDFWHWACFTIDTLMAAGRRFFVKPHPNQISMSDGALLDLKRKYSDLPVLSSRITNVQLVEAGMQVGVTMYGTVAHELAYLGVPTIACARHPHHAFDFTMTAKTIEEYAAYLRGGYAANIDRGTMRRQALEFFFMHNLHEDPCLRLLKQRYVELWTACHKPLASAELARLCRQLWDLPAFQAATDRLLHACA